MMSLTAGSVQAQVKPAEPKRLFSQCQAIARTLPGVRFARFDADNEQGRFLTAQSADDPVTISYLGHSTFLLQTPGGTSIATDFSGWHAPATPPMVATMNRAHSTHYTLTPDPAIQYVLHGWSDVPNEPMKHELMVGDTFIRNVTTDIRGMGGFEKDGNSIFIFEVAGLCIGHLGHLHHELAEGHYAAIGRLDVVMVPVDGGLTMGKASMSKVVQRLRSSVILPMHRRGAVIEDFLGMFGGDFDVVRSDDISISISLRSLPRKPTIVVLKGV